ncbi:type IV conjugative transfer system coupling protein TraD [Photobacterium frigidiphilum]|uniref:Type IV conjugative transfer system coupling protein TraD n=1 Tax=Photobacterium frigidiphilum TaxID=264736 RepID=A0A2T3J7W0_9GAMM|nr:type IV conjugative transfer system coupling protein TraD [Photobacterium frigidiphilum]PSU44854.1 type IV conjugative transfer system coupling protein TraD [Photobacterium frigidiphilum]
MTNKRPKHSNYTRGGQITFHNLTMFLQINAKLVRWMGYAIVAFTVLLCVILLDKDTLKGTYYFWLYNVIAKIKPDTHEVFTIWDGMTYKSTLGQQLANPFFIEANAKFWFSLQLYFLASLLSGLTLFTLAMSFFKKKGDEQTEDHFIRGVRIAEPPELAKELKKKKQQSPFAINGLNIFKNNFEVQHMLIDGTTGSGKSVALRKILRWIKARGDKAIIYDKGCTFVSKFYNPETDIILNPFDERCAFWDAWCDAKDATDFENMAAALIPMNGDGDPFWVQSARTIFTSTAFKMVNEPNRTTERLLELMLTSELESLSEYLKGTESASLVSDKIQKTAISIKSVLAAYIKSLRFLEGLDQKDDQGNPLRPRFSIRDWVKDDDEKGFLFLSSNAQQHASLRPLISMWLSIASTAILEQNENPDRRIWVIMDEAPSLHKLPELSETISEVRKFGGCYIIGIQSYAQLSKIYGNHAGKEIFDLLNTRLFFRAPSNEMAKVSSQELGEQEMDISKENYSYGAHAMRDGISLGHQTITRPAVIPSEIMQLDDLQCWLRSPGNFPITKLDLKFDKMRDLCPPFIKRDYAPSEKMQSIEQMLTYCQISALNLLSTEEQHQLMGIHTAQFEDDDERDAEEARMKATIDKAKAAKKKTAEKDKKPSSDKQAEKKAKEKEQADGEAVTEQLFQEEQNINEPEIF